MIGSRLSWISPWGLAAAAFASLAVLLAVSAGIRWLTVAAALVGLLVGLVGSAVSRGRTTGWGRASLVLGSALCVGVLLLALVAPTVLNPWWNAGPPAPEVDPNQCEVVPRNLAWPGQTVGGRGLG